MLFSCNVRTVRGQEDLSIDVYARNQGIAHDRALTRAVTQGLTPTGRCRVFKLQARRGSR